MLSLTVEGKKDSLDGMGMNFQNASFIHFSCPHSNKNRSRKRQPGEKTCLSESVQKQSTESDAALTKFQ